MGQIDITTLIDTVQSLAETNAVGFKSIADTQNINECSIKKNVVEATKEWLDSNDGKNAIKALIESYFKSDDGQKCVKSIVRELGNESTCGENTSKE